MTTWRRGTKPARWYPRRGEVCLIDLDNTVVFVNEPHIVQTRYPAFLILHNPPPIREQHKAFAVEGTRDRTLIATSRYAAALWAGYLDVDVSTISVVYPFAEPCFATQSRPGNKTGKIRILFAGRLSPEKGIYTLLETLHIDIIEQDKALTFTDRKSTRLNSSHL